MTAAAFSLKLDPDLQKALDQLAEAVNTEPALLAEDVLRRYLPLYETHRLAILEGIEDADAGRTVDHALVKEWINSWGGEKELERPACDE